MVIDAVLRNLELIGEASNSIPDNLKEQFSEIPWSEMIGLRIITAHKYFKIDLTIIWDIITKDLPNTKPQIQDMYNKLYKKQ